MADLVALQRIAREEYADIMVSACRVDAKLRVLLTDESYLDFWWSEVEPGRFTHHWNRQQWRSGPMRAIHALCMREASTRRAHTIVFIGQTQPSPRPAGRRNCSMAMSTRARVTNKLLTS